MQFQQESLFLLPPTPSPPKLIDTVLNETVLTIDDKVSVGVRSKSRIIPGGAPSGTHVISLAL